MTGFTIGALIVIGFLLLGVEIFVPGGLIGLFGVLAILVALIGSGTVFGASVAFPLGVGCLIVALVFFFAWAKYFPDSKMGSRFNLKTRIGKESGYTSQDLGLESLIGGRGEAVSDLHPSGIAKIEGRRLDVVTQGAYISKGSPIEVLEVNSNRIVVRSLGELSDKIETA